MDLAWGKLESGEIFIRYMVCYSTPLPARLTFLLGDGLTFIGILSYILLLAYLIGLTAWGELLRCINVFVVYHLYLVFVVLILVWSFSLFIFN